MPCSRLLRLFVIFMVSFSSETTRRSVRHLLTIFLIASWCLFRISLLCSAFLKYFLFLSPPQHLLCLEMLSFLHFLSFPSFLFCLLPLPCVVSITSPPPPSHRYLTPRLKAEFYDVTKWVEDVNRNTQGPYLRYYLRPCPVPPHACLKTSSLLVWFVT